MGQLVHHYPRVGVLWENQKDLVLEWEKRKGRGIRW